jgi:LysM repeat protein
MTDDGRAPTAPGGGAPFPGTTAEPAGPPTHDICPFLVAADGGWRSVAAVREHRCTAVTPAAPLAVEKQRRLCLTAEHAMCATYLAAGEARAMGHRATPMRRPMARTTPVVLDQGRWSVQLPEITSMPGIGQGALVVLLALAFAAVLIARLATSGSSGAGVPVGSPTPAASAVAGADASQDATAPEPTSGATTAPSPTLVPTENKPTPTPKAAKTTYKVKKGDTLSGIALKFGTTVKALQKLNKISDPSQLHVGQVLKLPKPKN